MKVGIAGYGTIGRRVALALDQGMPGLTLCGVVTRSSGKAQRALAQLARPVPLLSMAELAQLADVVVDCAPRAAFAHIAPAVVAGGKILVTVSGAALLEHPEVIDAARASAGRVILATGALLGLDAVRAAAEGQIHSVVMITRKPPQSLADAPPVVAQGLDLMALREPLRLFRGTARDGARLFPANVNVAAALGLAGIGPDLTQLEIWADPALTRNTHTIKVDADSARFEMRIENVPSEEHPGTGKITALSVIACLRSLVAPLRVGT
ncbi:MAG TPA: aspartate dehydrogenase [Steroidobacteraceae bacterium]|nr:aspartate dehydrogenase [Steroidobacteraceae bacterium]HRX87911.1 aspartate dehydrogenase [Steroidobacteraceae bacterium]